LLPAGIVIEFEDAPSVYVGGASAAYSAPPLIEPNPVTRFVGTQLEHVEWGGLNFYDLIYPLFLFIVGVSIVLSGRPAFAASRSSAPE